MSEQIISTRFTKEYKVKFPFASAGLAFIGSTPDLAVAVARAGGIGGIGTGPLGADVIRSIVRDVKKATDQPFHVNFITFMANEKKIRACVEEGVPIVSFHWGHPPKEFIDILQQANIKVWEQVGSVDAAKRAVDDGIDVVIAQGSEAGGHNFSTLPTFVLVPEIVDAVKPEMVLAAGGITTGAQVAAALCLGADGVWVGTRLVASKEAFAHQDYKERLIRAKGTETRLTSIFGPEWADFNPMRVVENSVVREFLGKEGQVPASTENEGVIGKTSLFGREQVLRRFTNFLPIPGTEGNFEEMPILAGQGVGMIRDIRPAEEIVKAMMGEAAATLGRLRI